MNAANSPGPPTSPTENKGNQGRRIVIREAGNPSEGFGLEKNDEVLRSGNKEEVNGGKINLVKAGSGIEKEFQQRGHRSEYPVRGDGSGDQSWVAVAKEKKVMKKYDLEILDKEGQKVVEIPHEVIEKANHLWEDYLIGKFLDTPHVAKVHAIVSKMWNQGDKSTQIDVHIVDDTTMKFKVLNPLMRARILKRGMWNIGNIPMVVQKWMPDELKEKSEVTAVPLWVHLKNVPMNMYSWQGLSFITSAVGFPDRLHPETAACTNFKIAKIFVNADLTKELPSKINFTKDGKTSLVEFSYPWLPPRCNGCGKWGHLDKVCAQNKKVDP